MSNPLIPPKKHVIEKKEFLRHEEIKTMQKRIAELRELESQKEKEKIMGLKPETKREERMPEMEKTTKESNLNNILERARELDEQKKMSEDLEKKRVEIQKREAIVPKPEQQEEKTPPSQPVQPQIQEKKIVREATTKITEQESAKGNLAEIEKTLESLGLQEQSVKENKKQILADLESQRANLKPVLEKERIIEGKKGEIEEREKNANRPEKKNLIENERWQIEKERREIEMARWSLEEKIENLNKDLENCDLEYRDIKEEETAMSEKKTVFLKAARKTELREERDRLKIDLQKIEIEKNPREKEKDEFLAQKTKLSDDLLLISNNEKSTEENIVKIEEKEKNASDPAEKRAAEQERWKLEEERENLERERRQKEEEKSSLQNQIKKSESDFHNLVIKESQIKEKIEKIDAEIGQEQETPEMNEPKEIPKEEKKEPLIPNQEKKEEQLFTPANENKESPVLTQIKDSQAEIKDKIERIINEKGKLAKEAPKPLENQSFPASLPPVEKPYQKTENETRIEETKRRLSEIQKKEELERKAFLERLQKSEAPQKNIENETQMPSAEVKTLSKKPSGLGKLWARLVIVVAVLAVSSFLIAFWYWFFIIQRR